MEYHKKYKKNETYNNFKLIEKNVIEEIKSNALIFEHNKTKTKLLFLENDSIDKTFSITFKTIPKTSNGVAHILEHSVLNGSEKYPLKDPFAELLRSSICTFLNAFTFPDKTMYPFSTTNDKEYLKIMDVYLDAVFFPRVHKKKEIFMQEGWRYEFENKNNKLNYNGVVYNEMKGAFSSPDRVLYSNIQRSLLKDTVYGVESGGIPEEIVDLTYEEFLEFHKKHYHPSKAYIIINGKINLENTLELIDKNFLSKFNFEKETIEITKQKEIIKRIEKESEYPINNKEITDKYLYGLYYKIGDALDSKLITSFNILSSILMDYESSPLKRKLIEAEISEEVYGGFMEELIYEPLFGIVLKNSKSKQKEKFIKIVENTLKDLVKNGIDKDLIEGVLNSIEFNLREGNLSFDGIPKGIGYAIKVMDSWLYKDHPLLYLKYNKDFIEIKEKALNKNLNYFEELIEKWLLKNNNSCIYTLKPNPELDLLKNVEKKLEEYQNKITPKETEIIKKENDKVKEFQEKLDKKEITNLIKTISIKDIEKLPKKEKYEIIEEKNYKLYKFESKIENILYFKHFFELKTEKIENLYYISLIISLLNETKTKKYNNEELSNLKNKYFGDLSFKIVANSKENKQLEPKIMVESKFLKENSKKTIELFNEILKNALFDKKKTKEILKKLKVNFETDIIESGHKYAISNVIGNVDKKVAFNDYISGLNFYNFICETLKNFNTNETKIMEKINKNYENLFNGENLIIGVATTENEDYIKDYLNKFELEYKKTNYEFNLEISLNNELRAVKTSSGVNYVGMGANFKSLGFEYDGELKVLQKILSNKYLYENIRVKGGAYGNGINFSNDGNCYFFSYRDPNLDNTIKVFKEMINFIEELNLDKEELNRYIISTINMFDKPLEIEDTMKLVLLNELSGITWEMRVKEREEILNCNLENIKTKIPLLKKLLEKNNYSVIGNSKLIENSNTKFNKYIEL